MALGYDGKLYILAFDHRGSFQKKMFGIEGDPTPEQTATIADAKHLIYEGMVKVVSGGAVPGDQIGVLVDEQYGGDVPAQAKAAGLKLAMPVEKSGQDDFDFEYGDAFGDHIEVRPRVLEGARALQPRGRHPLNHASSRSSSGSPTGCMRRPQVPVRAAGAGRGRPAPSRSAATPTATTPSCARS